jgi:hypothetical protein
LQNNFENGMPSPIQPMYLGQSVGFVEEALNPGLGRVRLFLRGHHNIGRRPHRRRGPAGSSDVGERWSAGLVATPSENRFLNIRGNSLASFAAREIASTIRWLFPLSFFGRPTDRAVQ